MPHWHVLIVSLPTRHATQRMRVWRALKVLGCGILRDGVYILPAIEGLREELARSANEVVAAGGQAQVLSLDAADKNQEAAFRALFDRSAEYTELHSAIDGLLRKVKRSAAATLAREVAQLRKAFTALTAVDYFPGPPREQVGTALKELEEQITAKLNPDEPRPMSSKIERRDRADYQGRTWATRKHLWVDRMASAWLIARFIDARPTFRWLTKPKDCPKKALGFDFDGAAFTHVGSRVTFEVLLASFGLDEDTALTRIGSIVHFLDTGGVPVAEAAGLEMVLKGLRRNAKNDDALLAAVRPIFDGLYEALNTHSV